MIQLEIANINLLERIKKGQVNFMKKKITAILMVILIGIMAAGCGQQQKTEQTEGTEESASQDIFATAYGADAESAVSDAIAEIERLDALLSTGETDSEIYKLNQNGGGSISEDTSYLLERALEIWKSTDGCFEIGIYPLMQEWGFTDGNYKVPDKETLQKLLPLADSSKIDFNEKDQTVSFEQDGMEIDFGGIAKGYTSGRIMDIFREHLGHLKGVKLVYMGDARYNMGNSLMIACAKLGMHFVACAPEKYFPNAALVEECQDYAKESGGSITLTEDVKVGTKDARSRARSCVRKISCCFRQIRIAR